MTQTTDKNSRTGFGLVEILVVVAIIAVLALVLMPRYFGGTDPVTKKKILAPRDRAKKVAGTAYIDQINQAILMYKMDHEDQFPERLGDLKAYGVTDEMLIDPVTRLPLPYDPQTGRVGQSNGPDSLGGGANLPQVQ